MTRDEGPPTTDYRPWTGARTGAPRSGFGVFGAAKYYELIFEGGDYPLTFACADKAFLLSPRCLASALCQVLPLASTTYNQIDSPLLSPQIAAVSPHIPGAKVLSSAAEADLQQFNKDNVAAFATGNAPAILPEKFPMTGVVTFPAGRMTSMGVLRCSSPVAGSVVQLKRSVSAMTAIPTRTFATPPHSGTVETLVLG